MSPTGAPVDGRQTVRALWVMDTHPPGHGRAPLLTAPSPRLVLGSVAGGADTIAIFSFTLAAAGVIIAGLSMVAVMSWTIALLMLALAVFFACLMVLPGHPRRWGPEYFNTITRRNPDGDPS